MYRGTTPTNVFNVNADLREKTVYLTYKQGSHVRFEKTNNDMTITEDAITVKLTQQDTLSLTDGLVYIQIRYVGVDGTAGASDIIRADVKQILKDGEI